jgi:hypothetical protein
VAGLGNAVQLLKLSPTRLTAALTILSKPGRSPHMANGAMFELLAGPMKAWAHLVQNTCQSTLAPCLGFWAIK